MSVVIVGGNECMVRRYKEICSEFDCTLKIFPKMSTGIISRIGCPDLLIFFTGTMSHKMLKATMKNIKGSGTKITHSKSASASALRNILRQHTPSGL